jgi:hypothetical protein
MLFLLFSFLTINPYSSFEWTPFNPLIDTLSMRLHTIYQRNSNGVFIGSVFEKSGFLLDINLGALGDGIDLDKPHIGCVGGLKMWGFYLLGGLSYSKGEGFLRGYRGILGYERSLEKLSLSIGFERGKEDFLVYAMDTIKGFGFTRISVDTFSYSTYYSQFFLTLSMNTDFLKPSITLGMKKYDFGKRYNPYLTAGFYLGVGKAPPVKTPGSVKKKVGVIYVWKPNIYLYPEAETEVTVRLIAEDGEIIRTEPEYGDGFRVRVTPDGRIEGKYDYLFYEAVIGDINDLEFGWCVSSKGIMEFFEGVLREYGFNWREITDFIDYWSGKLPDAPYYRIYPLEKRDIDGKVSLYIEPEPGTLFRVWFYIIPSDKWMDLREPTIIPLKREGFTVVEWGVILRE